MTTGIDTLSINNDFFAQLKPHQLIFSYSTLPPEVHITIAFNDSSPDINLHITKNTGRPDRPSLEVVRINKKLLCSLQQLLTNNMLAACFEPLCTRHYHLYSKKRRFFSFDDLDNSGEGKMFKQDLAQAFNAIGRLKGRRKWKITGDIARPFLKVAKSRSSLELLERHLKNIPKAVHPTAIAGMLVSAKGTRAVVRFKDGWYALRTSQSFLKFICFFVETEAAKSIVANFQKIIELVSRANTQSDLEGIDLCIRLETNPALNEPDRV